MACTQVHRDGSYAVGEEVVVTLCEVDVFDLDRSARLPDEYKPSWTIGSVIRVVPLAGCAQYLICFRHRGAACVCVVESHRIEGVA